MSCGQEFAVVCERCCIDASKNGTPCRKLIKFITDPFGLGGVYIDLR